MPTPLTPTTITLVIGSCRRGPRSRCPRAAPAAPGATPPPAVWHRSDPSRATRSCSFWIMSIEMSTPTSARIRISSSSSQSASSITCWVNRLVTREKTPSRVLARLSRNGLRRFRRSNIVLVSPFQAHYANRAPVALRPGPKVRGTLHAKPMGRTSHRAARLLLPLLSPSSPSRTSPGRARAAPHAPLRGAGTPCPARSPGAVPRAAAARSGRGCSGPGSRAAPAPSGG